MKNIFVFFSIILSGGTPFKGEHSKSETDDYQVLQGNKKNDMTTLLGTFSPTCVKSFGRKKNEIFIPSEDQ